jgi:hypothetical protein
VNYQLEGFLDPDKNQFDGMTYHNNALQDCSALAIGFSQNVPSTDVGNPASVPIEPSNPLTSGILRLQYFRKPVSLARFHPRRSYHYQ